MWRPCGTSINDNVVCMLFVLVRGDFKPICMVVSQNPFHSSDLNPAGVSTVRFYFHRFFFICLRTEAL